MSRFDATTYLEGHGWRGKGVPLDGEKGRGLKKPLALPQKRNVKGLGKERDRATEWWDSLFEASAKKIQAPAPPKASPVATGGATEATAATLRQTPSLMALAKREHARKQLMSGFVRGRPNKEYEDKVKELERVIAEQQHSSKTSIESTSAASESEADSLAVRGDVKLSKEERKRARHERKLRKEESEQSGDAEKRERKKRRRHDEATLNDVKTKKRKESKAKDESVPTTEDSDKVQRKEAKRRKKEKAKQSNTVASAKSSASDAKEALKKSKG